eukprot:12932687-Prorocentrum_lima.AAC.1
MDRPGVERDPCSRLAETTCGPGHYIAQTVKVRHRFPPGLGQTPSEGDKAPGTSTAPGAQL